VAAAGQISQQVVREHVTTAGVDTYLPPSSPHSRYHPSRMLRASGGGGGGGGDDQSPHTGVMSFATPPSPRARHHGSSHAEAPQARSELGLADVRTAQQLMENLSLGASAGGPCAASSSVAVTAHEDVVHAGEPSGESAWARVEAAVRTQVSPWPRKW
jgi:hypothetical protein